MNTNHWQNGDTGKYFYFAEEEFSTMVGYEDWSDKLFEVMQHGSQSWTGQVKVWKHDSGAHGRRDSGDGAADQDTFSVPERQGSARYVGHELLQLFSISE